MMYVMFLYVVLGMIRELIVTATTILSCGFMVYFIVIVFSDIFKK